MVFEELALAYHGQDRVFVVIHDLARWLKLSHGSAQLSLHAARHYRRARLLLKLLAVADRFWLDDRIWGHMIVLLVTQLHHVDAAVASALLRRKVIAQLFFLL